ncbi:PREDICTED: fatty acyl-CoA reductase 1-like [Papilio polytes]|uniref:fatty acyl-CoA reductase 1-like n=1 Tax=Papilio polytes TaxID=76194 RepID=UPI00067641AD|nr:PREDICTED: fatty acyl-CoA reductase 1-like [Papilio polytes]
MGFLEDRDFSAVPQIPQYYRGKTLFITGGSGFMGKVLVEKLLYSCSELDRIYLLLRTKKNVKSEDRLQDIYSSPCFDRLRQERPGLFESKVFVVSGDASEIGLGLSVEDRALLVNRVNIIFHVAASVRFDDPLEVAARLNLRGTREVVELAKEVRFLEVLLHVSTSYANTNRDPIEEILYPPLADWRDTLAVCEQTDHYTLKVLTPKYLGELPNTYTFTKQLAEHVVYEQRGQLPAVIMRPSIVISTHQEPMPGWIENFNGPVGIFVASGKGILRSVYSDPDLVSDYMPVDVAIKAFIAAAWARGTKPLVPSDDIPVYNCCAGDLNKITIGALIELGRKVVLEIPLNDALWPAGGSITTYKSVYYIKVLLVHLLPALFIDSILWIAGKNPMLVKIQRRIYIANLALRYYLTQQWTFSNKNFVKLRSSLKEEDKEDFYYELERIDKVEFFKQSCLGGRKFLLKEKDEDLPKAKAHYRRIVILDIVVKCLFYGFVLWRLLHTAFIQDLLQSICSLIFE